MKICIDLGTARTAIAIKDDSGNWLNLPEKRQDAREAGTKNLPLDTLLQAMQGVEVKSEPIPHLVVLSRYCKLSDIVMPFCLDANFFSVPVGVELFPGGRKDAFENIKESAALVTPFLASVTQLVATISGEGAQWVVGKSAGGIDLRRFGLPPGSKSFNEAVAVIHSLVSHNVGKIRDLQPRPFVLVADLGGGFLDVSVADDIKFEESGAAAAIVNYGGYPIGVDRIDPSQRFSTASIDNPEQLLELVEVVINYHIWDYVKRVVAREGANGRSHLAGLVVLTGGGFKRLKHERLKDNLKYSIGKFTEGVISKPVLDIQVKVPAEDTKYLTLAGLGRMEEANISDDEDEQRDISRRSPNHHGTEVLKWAKLQPRVAERWSALLDQERRDRYER
jgi:hypothetical protein